MGMTKLTGAFRNYDNAPKLVTARSPKNIILYQTIRHQIPEVLNLNLSFCLPINLPIPACRPKCSYDKETLHFLCIVLFCNTHSKKTTKSITVERRDSCEQYFTSAMNNSSTHKESLKASERNTAKLIIIILTFKPHLTDIFQDT